jgi:hypothetical protein
MAAALKGALPQTSDKKTALPDVADLQDSYGQ